ncbi:hypothetical protein [Flammeovirga aprica]|uniref:Outer membrane protein beta-barrel domain-containing protein n=1 Tax=Flammeovirga aprica JL-4 TaxID=694437 RepID=A0A7X9P3B3_9BACT|nr:hypothetical protein [Flammeovirga aprica]NME68570.1 hypothetical protein [Flammeovirga aprica JL-4]
MIVAFLLCFSKEGKAQYAVWKAGIGFQSENIFSSKWKESISAVNTATGISSPAPNWGWGWNLSSDYLVKDGIAVGFRFANTYYSNSTNSPFQTASSEATFVDFTIYGDFYLLKYFKNPFLPYFQESFFVRAAPSYHTSTISTSGQMITETDTISTSGGNATSGLGLGLGVGYTKYVTDRISITGLLSTNFYYASSSIQIPTNGLLEYGGSTSSSFFLTRMSAEVKVAYTIKQRKPLCPIKTCGIQQEHSHAVLGGAVVRGNIYKYRQNQKYGDVHRGQPNRSKRKKTKSEKQQQKLQKKEKRNRKRLKIIGAGH